MQRDMAKGVISELDLQIGAFVRHAEVKGVDVPRFAAIYAALLPAERDAERMAMERRQCALERRLLVAPRVLAMAAVVGVALGLSACATLSLARRRT